MIDDPIKVFYFASYDLGAEMGGGTTHVEGIAKGFHNMGWKVTLFSGNQGTAKQPEFPFSHVLVKKKSVSIRHVLLMQLKLACKLFLRRGPKPDLIYFRHSPIMFAPVLYAILYKIPYFCEVNGLRETESSYSGLLPFILKFEDWIFKRACGVFCVTEELKTFFSNRTKQSESKFPVVCNGVDADIWPDKYRVKEFQFGGKYRIGFIGHFQERQGVETIINALPKIREEVGDVRFIIAGSGPAEEAYRKSAKKSDVSEYVHFPGYVAKNEIASLMAVCDVAVAPYTGDFTEGSTGLSPLKIFTYLACERIVVTCDLRSLHKFKKCPSVYFAAADSSEDYAEVIIKILNMSQEARSKQGRLGREYVLAEYTWDQVAEKTGKIMLAMFEKDTI